MHHTTLRQLQRTLPRAGGPSWARKPKDPKAPAAPAPAPAPAPAAATPADKQPLRAANGVLIPPDTKLWPEQKPLHPRTDRRKGLMDSFRSLPSNTRLALGLSGIALATTVWAVDSFLGQGEETEPVRPSNWGVRVVARER